MTRRAREMALIVSSFTLGALSMLLAFVFLVMANGR